MRKQAKHPYFAHRKRITITCPECGQEASGVVEGEGGCGDDGTGVRWWLEDRVGCDCLDDGELIEVWENTP